ncbi:MAG: hypothetical protein AAFR17_09440 [Pseudomonadota bacterium]
MAFPGHVEGFLRLKAKAPVSDRSALARLMEQEVAPIALLEWEVAGTPDNMRPLVAYIAASARGVPAAE